jgi:Type II secretion system (T2SS), protein E, N-terminal domain
MKTRIGHILVRDDLVSEAQLARALEVQNFAGGRIGTLLMERGALGEEDLGKTLAQQHGCGYMPWSALSEIPEDTIAVLPSRFALKHCAVPFEKGEGYVKMALRDPTDLRILDELVFVTGRKVFVSVAPEVRIYQALEKYYGKLRAPRYAVLAERLSRPRGLPIRSAAPPPPPDFFEPRPSSPPKPIAVSDEAALDIEAGPEPPPSISPLSPDAQPAPPRVERSFEDRPRSWGNFLSPELQREPPGEPEGIPWEDTTRTRLRKQQEATPPAAPPPFEEAAAFDFSSSGRSEERPPPASTPPPSESTSPVPEESFSRILTQTERDAIADAVLEALVRRFPGAAIFSSRSEGVAGWTAAGDRVRPEAIRAFSTSWVEPSVFLNARLSRTFYLGPLSDLPRHEQLAEALGGWPGECLVQPVLIQEKPVAFLLAVAPEAGRMTAEDISYSRELAEATASALANAIRLKKKEI